MEKKAEDQKKNEQKELKKLVNESLPLLIDKFKIDLFMGRYKLEPDIFSRLEYLDMPREMCSNYLVAVVELDDYTNIISQKSLEEIDVMGFQVTKIVEQHAKKTNNSIYARIDDNHWAIILNNQQKDQIIEQENEFSAELLSELNLQGMSASIGLSNPFDSLVYTNDKLKEGLYALDFKFNLGNGQIIRINDIQSEQEYKEINISEVDKTLKSIIYSGEEAEVNRYINQLFSLERFNPNKNSLKNLCYSILTCTQLILIDLNVRFEDVFGKGELIWDKLVRFETIVDAKQWLINILTEIIRYINNRNNNQINKIVESVKLICEKNYNTSITIKAIADQMFYNPNYLNNIFKQETGETILEYITKLRIEKAKLLLRQSGLKIYEIAQEVGYSHESYFRNLFKQHVAIGPKEYREIQGG